MILCVNTPVSLPYNVSTNDIWDLYEACGIWQFQPSGGVVEEHADLWIGFCAFHLGDHRRAMEVCLSTTCFVIVWIHASLCAYCVYVLQGQTALYCMLTVFVSLFCFVFIFQSVSTSGIQGSDTQGRLSPRRVGLFGMRPVLPWAI